MMGEGSNSNRSEGPRFSDLPAEAEPPILVLGLGNDPLADDGVGEGDFLGSGEARQGRGDVVRDPVML